MGILTSDQKPLKPLGFCMYCGSTKQLSKEHIIPRAFLGDWVFPKSSCESCRLITHAFETECASKMLGLHRTQMKFPSKKPRARPRGFSVGHVRFNREEVGRASHAVTDWKVPIIMPVFDCPRILEWKPPAGIVSFVPWLWFPDVQETHRIVGTSTSDGISIELSVAVGSLMRMMAKIAYGVSVALFGFDAVSHSPLRRIILGAPHASIYIGSKPHPLGEDPPAHKTHWLIEPGVFDRGDKKFLCMGIELMRYAYAGASWDNRLRPYWVVVGEASPPLAAHALAPDYRKPR